MILLLVASRFEVGETAKQLRREIRDGCVAIREIGIGPAKARLNSAKWLDQLRPDWVISAGFSAGLHPESKLGDVFVSEEFAAWGRFGLMKMVDRILETQADKHAVFLETGAVVADMESEAVREVCAERGIRFGAIRVVSDDVATPFPVKAEILFDTEGGKPRTGRLLAHLLTHPAAIPGFIHFVQACKKAERELSLVTHTVVTSLSISP